MSYDVYFWYRSKDVDVDTLLDDVAQGDVASLEPHPSVRAFRRDLLMRLPHLVDVVEPSEASQEADRYVSLTLPSSWTDQILSIVKLVDEHGLRGWDPQLDEPIGSQFAGPAQVQVQVQQLTSRPSLDGFWTIDPLLGLGIGRNAISRAWSLVGLPPQIRFGQAVGVYILAMALRDGVTVDADEARRAVDAVAAHCATGIPTQEREIQIGYTNTDVTGLADYVALGGWR